MIDPFLDACGATGPLVIGTESAGGPGVETRAFDLPFVLAGGDPRSDLRLAHPDVSDRHAYLQLVDGQLVCIDLGSRIGVYQGGKCQRLAYLERGQAVRIGPYRVRLVGGDSESDAPCDAPCPPLRLALSHRGVRESFCELPRGLALVGSAADCQIRLIDPSVSNYHCSLVHTPGGVWVVDLLGQGGVRVNGRDVGYARVHEGDSLHIGHSVIRVLTPSDVAASAPVLSPASSDDGPPPPPPPATIAAPDQTAELTERVLGPVVSQIGLMRQQMVEEFQQSRAMLFETLSTLQREQTAFVDQELEEIRTLSQELHSLRADLERQTRLLAEQVDSFKSSSSTRLGAATTSAPRAAPPDTLPVAVPRLTFNGHSPRPGGPSRGAHNPPPRHDATVGLVRARTEDAHARLCQKIAGLKAKRQTRWERLMALFPKGAPGKPTS